MPLFTVLIATALYAFAFLQIYTEPITRVRASEWIYRNIAAGATITDESWDDSLPFALLLDGRGRSQGEYKVVTMNLQEPDDARKLENLKQWLKAADFVVISSNRMYGWLPRLADRFSLTKRYYDLLFDEQLGFKPVAEFTSYPRLGPLQFNDDRSDESFTVYDHPKVLIYKKERALNDGEFNALFADAFPTQNPSAPAVTTTARDKSLMLDRPVDELPVVNDRAWNPIANASQWVAVAWWWLVVELLGLLALPLTLVVFRRFADGGYILAKSLGLLLVAYIMWMLASFHFVIQHALTIWLITLALLALALVQLFRRRAQVAQFVRAHIGIIVLEEALFAFAFLAFVGVRLLDPDLWQPWNGGEKFMEFAFLNAILKSPYFPPYDPYFAGGIINYYYYGIYLVGVLVKLTGIASEVAFNLAIPTLFALTMANAFSVAYNLASQRTNPKSRASVPSPNQPTNHRTTLTAILSGLLAALFIAALGNLDGFMQVVEGLGKVAGAGTQSGIIGVDGIVKVVEGTVAVMTNGKSLPPFDYWRSSRVIPFTINEFPLWSFLFADLHPHMIGIPFTLLAIALAAHTTLRSIARRGPQVGAELDGMGELMTPLADASLHTRAVGLYIQPLNQPTDAEPFTSKLLFGFTLALTLGAVAAINTWDAPTYFGLGIGALLLARYGSGGLRNGGWWRALVGMGVVGVLSLALYWPFFNNYKALYVGLGLTDIHTEFQPFVVMWGFFLFAGLTFVLGEVARRTR
ncbi:MAG: DUF2298 domain-containing protein, partial [Chloroflexota bacterium]